MTHSDIRAEATPEDAPDEGEHNVLAIEKSEEGPVNPMQETEQTPEEKSSDGQQAYSQPEVLLPMQLVFDCRPRFRGSKH